MFVWQPFNKRLYNTIVIGFDCNIFSVDDLLRAGINKASHLVVVNRENSSDKQCEEVLGDSETIVAVQTIFKYVLRFLYEIIFADLRETQDELHNDHFIHLLTH